MARKESPITLDAKLAEVLASSSAFCSMRPVNTSVNVRRRNGVRTCIKPPWSASFAEEHGAVASAR